MIPSASPGGASSPVMLITGSSGWLVNPTTSQLTQPTPATSAPTVPRDPNGMNLRPARAPASASTQPRVPSAPAMIHGLKSRSSRNHRVSEG
mgnify:CR=1 FL=1|jgi:hypothetical protein